MIAAGVCNEAGSIARRLYDGSVRGSRKRRNLTTIGTVTTIGGVLLFVWVLWRVGIAATWSGFRQIGWGFLLIVLLGGVRFATRAAAWKLCIDAPHRLAFHDALAAVIAGDALGNATPLGPIVGEPTKAAYVRSQLPLASALTALAIENVLYTLSAAAMIAAGMVALLFQFELPASLREISEVAIIGVTALFGLALWLLWRQPALVSQTFAAIASKNSAGQARIEKLRDVEQQIYTFTSRRGAAVAPIIAAELLFHAIGVLEVHVTLWMMQGTPPAILTSFILETVYRLIKVVFKFIPMQVGVNEAGTALSTEILGLGAASGLTLGIVRKARELCWTLVGTALLVRHGLSARRILDDAELSTSRNA
jgi:hypothetical protein